MAATETNAMFGGANKKIAKLIGGTSSLSAGMGQLIKFCNARVRSPVWRQFRDLDYLADQEQMSHWLEQLLAKKPPPQRIKGLWFGLFNPRRQDGLATCALHLAGSSRFNFDVQSLDCFSEPQYLPAENDADSAVLTTIFRTLERFPSAGAQGEYTLCWGYACLLVRDWCRGPARSKLLGTATRRGVAVGFDSGDGLVVDILA